MHDRRAVRERGRSLDDDGVRLDVELDELGRVLGDVTGFGDHDGDRITDETHVTFRERCDRRHRSVGPDHRVPDLAEPGVEFGTGENGDHTGHLSCSVYEDAA